MTLVVPQEEREGGGVGGRGRPSRNVEQYLYDLFRAEIDT